jgi:SHS2 domain-containing protein
MSTRPFEILAHTADTGIATTGDTLGDVIANAAHGMFALMYDMSAARPTRNVEFAVAARTPVELLVDVLVELLYRSEVDDVSFTDLVVNTECLHAGITGRAVPTDTLELRGPPIKAVTYHDLRCEHVGDRWEARIIFDV